MFRKHCLHLCVQSQVCGPQAKLCQPSQMSFSLRCHFPGKIFSIIFILKEKILFIFRCHFSVMIFFKLFPSISFAFSTVKPSKLINFLIFLTFCCCQLARFGIFSLYLCDMPCPLSPVVRIGTPPPPHTQASEYPPPPPLVPGEAHSLAG